MLLQTSLLKDVMLMCADSNLDGSDASLGRKSLQMTEYAQLTQVVGWMQMNQTKPEIVIPKEDAVFWMDENGRWCNQYGPFAHKKIIDYFNRSIGKDQNGYFVSQDKGDVLEKVYFRYADTALHVFDVRTTVPPEIILNTGRRIVLDPEKLFIENDILYLCDGDDRIRFTDRAMMKIASMLEEEQDGLYFKSGKKMIRIPESGDCP